MNRSDLLRCIGDTSYNVGLGAKRNFATHDIVVGLPRFVGWSSGAVGLLGLVWEPFSSKILSAGFAALALGAMYVTPYNHKREDYANAGEEMTRIFNDLKGLYFKAKAADDAELDAIEQERKTLEARYMQACLSDQIFFSDWYAHYKFFWQQQTEWVAEARAFTFWRDKVPLSLSVFVVGLLLVGIAMAIARFCS